MFVRILLVVLVILLWTAFARSSSGSGGERVYVVERYDTLWSIAERQYGGDPRRGVWRIQERNGLEGSLLRPGQRLQLP
jgi:nucleoid-associated protein YgaU